MPKEQKSTTLSGLNPELVTRIQKLLQQEQMGGIIEAMKLYMHAVGVGLKDAKLAIDKEMDFLGIQSPTHKLISSNRKGRPM